MIYGFSVRVPIVDVAFSVAICRLDERAAAELAAMEEAARELAARPGREAGTGVRESRPRRAARAARPS
jgi:hypothetical protein